MYKDGKVRRKLLCKASNNINNIKNMRLFIIQNYLNVFLVEESSIKDNCYRVSHYNFSPSNYHINKYHINNIRKNNEYIYRLNIDNMNNMIFTYDTVENNNRSVVNTNTLIFNYSNKKWMPSHKSSRSSSSFSNFKSTSTIKDDIFEYCYSILYKS